MGLSGESDDCFLVTVGGPIVACSLRFIADWPVRPACSAIAQLVGVVLFQPWPIPASPGAGLLGHLL